MEKDIHYMAHAIKLANKYKGLTHPNPTVGAVIVKNNRIIGEGFHKGAGFPHAEIEAIQDAIKKGESLEDSTIYITLEPCCHYGRTPPCTDAIIKYGFKKVVIGTLDPNPHVSGKGVNILKDKGIEVVVGVLEKEAKKLNEDFFTFITEKRPYVHIKVAQTLDGKIATYTGSSKWITGEKSRTFAHRLRKEAGAVLVGINTVLIDNPKLTVRHIKTDKQPLRIVLDKNLKIPLNANALSKEAKTLIITSELVDKEKVKRLLYLGIEVEMLPVEKGRFSIKNLLELLYSKGVVQILVEGGASTITEFLKSGYLDRLSVFISPKIVGSEGLDVIKELEISSIQESYSFSVEEIKRFEDDIYISLKAK